MGRDSKAQGNTELRAVDMAIDAMPDDYSIKVFLKVHRAEVSNMLAKDYSEDEIRELFMEDGRREERKNTEAEKRRADAAEAELAKYKAKYGDKI